jgi:hypothetical protein
MSFSPFTESRIRQLQQERADRDAKRSEDAAKAAEQDRKSQEFYAARDAERRQSISPNEVTAAERRRQAIEFYANLHEQKQERERQQKIAKANPTLIALKTEYLADKTTASRRNSIVSQFIELYRQSYGKRVPVDALTKEWEQERRQATLQKIYGAASGAGTSEAK